MSAFTSSSRLACFAGMCAKAPSDGLNVYTAVEVAAAATLAPPIPSSRPTMSPALTGIRVANLAVVRLARTGPDVRAGARRAQRAERKPGGGGPALDAPADDHAVERHDDAW